MAKGFGKEAEERNMDVLGKAEVRKEELEAEGYGYHRGVGWSKPGAPTIVGLTGEEWAGGQDPIKRGKA
jgi:hypothetical protein